IEAGAADLEPRVVRPAGDRVDLPAEGGDPPAVCDVGRDDVEPHDLVHRDDELVDRDAAARVVELPVELVRLDPDAELLRAGGCRRNVLDPGQLVEDERGDRGQDQHRPGRPRELEVRVAADLRPLDVAPASAVAETDDEDDERYLDEDEDERREPEDQPVGVGDPVCVRRPRRGRLEAAAGGCRRARDDERDPEGGEQDGASRDGTAHGRGGRLHSPKHGIGAARRAARGEGSAAPHGSAFYEGGRRVARRAAPWPRRSLRGLRQRRPAAAGAGLRAGGRRARLHSPPRPGGKARLLALALTLPRYRGDLPAGRYCGRRLSCGRRPRGRHRPADSPLELPGRIAAIDHRRRPRAAAAASELGRYNVLLFAMATALAMAAAIALADLAGYERLAHVVNRLDPVLVPVIFVGQLIGYLGYVLAVRDIARVEDGPGLSFSLTTRTVLAGFGVFAATHSAGGFAVDYWAFRRAGLRRDEAIARVLGLGALEYAVLAPAALISAIALLFGLG